MSRLTLTLSACAVAGLIGLAALALHTRDAGPAKAGLPFMLPPSKSLTPQEALQAFTVEPGFRIELVAAEPMVEAPVAVSFDDQGRLYVVEMRGYMRDLAGSTEHEPTGRIKLLEDADGDGRMDKATVFLDGLVMPRSVMAVNGGALVAAPPNLLFCKDTNEDGKADVKEVVTTDFGTAGGQPEHMPNSPTWAMDNAVWSVGYGASFRLRAGVWQRGAGLNRGQYGLCQDNHGRLFYNDDSLLLRCDLLPAEAFARNPLMRDALSVNAPLMADQSVWPSHPTPGVNHGDDPEALRADGTLSRATAACGPVIYRGDAFPADCLGNAFIPEPAGNLVKRVRLLEKDGMIEAENTAQGRDFLTSTDERFRPVQAVNGPDGALYIVDMYRGIIQHSRLLTEYLKGHIAARKLDQPWDQGRIWRIVPDNGPPLKPMKVPQDSGSRIALMSHPNGWVRDTVQRLLVESGDAAAVPALTELLGSKKARPLARLHALWTLEGLSALTPDLLRSAFFDADAQVRAAAVRVAGPELTPELLPMTVDKDPLVLAHLAIKLSSFNLPDADAALINLLAFRGDLVGVREGALTGLRSREASFAQMLARQTGEEHTRQIAPVFEALATLVGLANKPQMFEVMLSLGAARPADDPIQLAVLKGLAGPVNASGKSAVPGKLLWLKREPEALSKLQTDSTHQESAALLAAISARLAWPGKSGAPAAPPQAAPLTAEQSALFEEGREVYEEVCAACHQLHGAGLGGLAPSLLDSEWVQGKPETLALIVINGLAGPIEVGSSTWNLAMPPLPQLTDNEVAAVLTYIRREWEHEASPVDTDFITQLRAKHKDRALMWTAEELKRVE